MKLKLQTTIFLTGFVAIAAVAQESTRPDPAASGLPDKEKLSYAQGMRFGLEVKRSGTEADVNTVIQGLKDVLEGKPTRIQEPEIFMLFRQAENYRVAKEAEKDKSQAAAPPTSTAQPPAAPPEPPDKEKLSYAMGMRMGGLLKRAEAEINADTVIQALKDVMEGKSTKIQESEIEPILLKAHEHAMAKEAEQNKAAGAAFLAKNAKEPSVKVLSDGLQYKVLQTGTGPVPTTNDLLFIKCRGRLLSGQEFFHHDHFLTRSTGGCQGWQDALQRMKVGDKWQIFVPPNLAFGAEGDPFQKIGPEATVTYDLELLSIGQPGDPGIGTGRMGHGLDGETSPPGS